ncbi:hypothetical protein NP233_g8335 [Leucocoprinus birnbaumii]|uniref:Uncharacterized protein n=1 Tax=Leucocoprinus birnbaumii TaxID=56174 RepID=A0AAD5VT03_9AGAR|nr:hypothetical protein NP233_g8335 [Leucocoprinus birnbaumii]
MACALIPAIHVSPPPPQEHYPEPYSPFRNLAFPDPDKDAFRPNLLTPPPSHTTFAKHLSPLCPPETPVNNKGLERERFEALLKASRERNALVGAKKAVDLRKEIAHKAHRHKLVERRALFLSKVQAPPSPTATMTPKTPPDSPAIFHYSLPSPGLVSPLAMFDTLHDNDDSASRKWVEQVDFRLPYDINKQVSRSAGLFKDSKTAQVLPSLDQISARLKTLATARSTSIVDGLRLPAAVPVSAPTAPSNRPATIEIGRLRMPVRAAKTPPVAAREMPPQSQHVPISIPPPQLPVSPFPSDLQVTTTVVPRIATASPAELTESNLKILDARERKAHNMLSTLRRRTLSTPQQPLQSAPLLNTTMPGNLTRNAARRTTPLPIPEAVMEMDTDGRKSRWKRHSAPADLMPRDRLGFEHPVFALPGAF